MLFLIKYANIGLLAAFLYPKNRRLELAFFAALLFQTSFGIMVLPNEWYLLGFISFATLYGVVSINEAIARGCLRDGLRHLNRWRKIS